MGATLAGRVDGTVTRPAAIRLQYGHPRPASTVERRTTGRRTTDQPPKHPSLGVSRYEESGRRPAQLTLAAVGRPDSDGGRFHAGGGQVLGVGHGQVFAAVVVVGRETGEVFAVAVPGPDAIIAFAHTWQSCPQFFVKEGDKVPNTCSRNATAPTVSR